MGMNNHTYLITVHLTANRMPHRHQSHPALQNKTLVNTNKGPDFNVPPRTFIHCVLVNIQQHNCFQH